MFFFPCRSARQVPRGPGEPRARHESGFSSYSGLAISAIRARNNGPAAFRRSIRGIITRTPAVVIGSRARDTDTERWFQIAMESVAVECPAVRVLSSGHYCRIAVSGAGIAPGAERGCSRTRGERPERSLDNWGPRLQQARVINHPSCRPVLLSPGDRQSPHRHVVFMLVLLGLRGGICGTTQASGASIVGI